MDSTRQSGYIYRVLLQKRKTFLGGYLSILRFLMAETNWSCFIMPSGEYIMIETTKRGWKLTSVPPGNPKRSFSIAGAPGCTFWMLRTWTHLKINPWWPMVMVISTIFHVYKLNIVKSHFQIDPFPKKKHCNRWWTPLKSHSQTIESHRKPYNTVEHYRNHGKPWQNIENHGKQAIENDRKPWARLGGIFRAMHWGLHSLDLVCLMVPKDGYRML